MGSPWARASNNNKASENEEELKCISHFSFPRFGARHKKTQNSERWLRKKKKGGKEAKNKASGLEGGKKRKKFLFTARRNLVSVKVQRDKEKKNSYTFLEGPLRV